MKKTLTLSTLSLLAFFWLCIGFAAAQNPEKLSRDDWAERFGSAEGFEDHGADRLAAPGVQGLQGGTYGLRTNACPAAFNMATPYNTNNGQRGCMFDVQATNAVTIRCFEANLYAGTTANYEIWYRPSSHVGFQNNAAGWTQLGTATGITSAGNNLPTALPIPVNVTIPAGQTYAFYITNDFGGGTSYTDGTAVGNFLASDANITVYEGVGKSYPFGLTFTVRNFNGTIFYDAAGPLDAGAASLSAQAVQGGVSLEWSISEEMALEGLSLERSEDGVRFASIADLAAEPSGTYLDRAAEGQSFYRLQMALPNGERSYSNVVELNAASTEGFELTKVFPNPFENQLNISIQNNKGLDLQLQILDRMGRVVEEQVVSGVLGVQNIAPELGHLSRGYYIVRIQGDGATTSVPVIRQ